MEQISNWCVKHWTWVAAGIGYIAFITILFKPAKRFFGENESEQ